MSKRSTACHLALPYALLISSESSCRYTLIFVNESAAQLLERVQGSRAARLIKQTLSEACNLQ